MHTGLTVGSSPQLSVRGGTATPLPPAQAVVLKHGGLATSASSYSPLPDGAPSPQPRAGSLGSSLTPPLHSCPPSISSLGPCTDSIITRRSLTSLPCLRTFQSCPIPGMSPHLLRGPQGPQTLPVRLLGLISHHSPPGSFLTSTPAAFRLQALPGCCEHPCLCVRCACSALCRGHVCSSLKATQAALVPARLSPL